MTKSENARDAILTKLWERLFHKVLPPVATNRGRYPLSVSPDTRVSQHAEGLTLLHIPTGQIFVCNRTAARIWQGAAEGRTADELSDELSHTFHIEREIARKDTSLIVNQMEHHGLIIRQSA